MQTSHTRATIAVTGTVVALMGLSTSALAGKHPRDLEIPELGEITVPTAQRFELDNGLVLYLLEDHEFPMVEVRTLTRGATAYDTPELIGLADMTAQVMRTGGTATIDGDALDERVERMGTQLGMSASESSFQGRFSTLTENLDETLALFVDIVRNPAFPDAKIDETRTQERTAIASRNDESLNIALREFNTLVFGKNSPYGWYSEYATIGAITAEHMRAVHARFFHPEQTILVAWGDFDVTTMRGKIEAALGTWPRGDVTVPPRPEVQGSTEAGLFYAEKTDVTQSAVLVGNLGIRRDDPQYAAGMVMQAALGGGFSSRIFGEIRTRRGLAYAAGSQFMAPYSRKGFSGAYVMTRADSTVASLRYLIAEIEKVREAGITEEELQRAKDGLLSQFVFQFDSVGEVVVRQARYEFHGYDPDFLSGYQTAVRAVTVADVKAAAETLFRPDEWQILVVGNAEEFSEPLDSLMPVTVLDISIPDPPVSMSIPAPTAESLARGQELIAAAVAAYGGASAIEKIKSLTTEGTGAVSVQGMTLQLGYTSIYQEPRRFYQEQQVMGQTMTQVVVEDTGWTVSPAGQMDMGPDDVEDHYVSQISSMDVTFLRDASTFELQALDSETIEGKTYDVLYVRSSGNDFLLLYLDPETGFVERSVRQGSHPMTGAPAENATVMGDFRDTSGVKFPYDIDIYIDGELFMDGIIAEITVNGDVDDSLFVKP